MKVPDMFKDLVFKIKLTWKRLLCNHQYVYEGEFSGFHRHRCTKCNKVIVERRVE